jgi:hypothetical protein
VNDWVSFRWTFYWNCSSLEIWRCASPALTSPSPAGDVVGSPNYGICDTAGYIPAKPKSTVELVQNTSQLKLPVLCPSFALTLTHYNWDLSS